MVFHILFKTLLKFVINLARFETKLLTIQVVLLKYYQVYRDTQKQ